VIQQNGGRAKSYFEGLVLVIGAAGDGVIQQNGGPSDTVSSETGTGYCG